MTSKELNEILNKTRRIKEISFTPEQVEELAKDLEALDIIKKWFMEKTTDYREYDKTLFVDAFIRDNEPIFKILEEWLDEEQH